MRLYYFVDMYVRRLGRIEAFRYLIIIMQSYKRLIGSVLFSVPAETFNIEQSKIRTNLTPILTEPSRKRELISFFALKYNTKRYQICSTTKNTIRSPF